MKSIETLINRVRKALLFCRTVEGALTEQEIEKYSIRNSCPEESYECDLPVQVHEVLIKYGKIRNPIISHCGLESLEVSSVDWIYRMEFDVLHTAEQYVLKCGGLDTIVDMYLNGIKIGFHRDMFYPFVTEITPKLNEKNILLFHFHSPVKYLEKMKNIHGEKPINPAHYIRKAPHDFEDFLGIKPYFATVGIFDEVVIEEYHKGKIEELEVSYILNEQLTEAEMTIRVLGKIFDREKYNLHYQIKDSEGKVVYGEIKKIAGGGKWEAVIKTGNIPVKLWWPNGYGKHTLYTNKVWMESEEIVVSTAEKVIGFRRIEFYDSFDISVNHIPVRLWGANLVPLNGVTHCFDEERASTIIQLAKEANMNILRFWGGGEPYPDELYSMADREGLLIWGEFFHKWGMYPEDEEYMELYHNEAVHMLKTFRHHPALMMWCGGNESHMGAEFDYPSQDYIGEKIFQEYERLCKQLDPGRYFQYDSPFDGAFTNDPREGDFHGWNHLWYVPYDKYPRMFSENSRVSPPILKSLRKYIPDEEELWPNGFQSRMTGYGDSLLPPAWMKLKTGPEPYWCSPVEQFYDAENPKELIYRCQAAHGQLMKRIGERLKRGRPAWDIEGKTRCKGQLIWKLNDSWPQIFCSLLDYNMEGGIPYYAIKRVFRQIQVSFDLENNITIWAVNDSRYTFKGSMEFVLFDPSSNKRIHSFEQKIEVLVGGAEIVCDLDRLHQFERKNILYACLKDEDGNIVARNYEFVELERNLQFPDAKLKLEQEGSVLIVSTDQFARCIELEGVSEDEDGRFIFEDNYFDLMPFEKRCIGIQSAKKRFTIQAKAFYAKRSSNIEFNSLA